MSSLQRPAHSALRHHWPLDPNLVFLNHGSFGACTTTILDHQHQLRQQLESNPVKFLHRLHDEAIDSARASLAEFLRSSPNDLSFITNATTGVNAVARSIPTQPGDEWLTTSLDYNACRNALIENAQRQGASVVVADVPFPCHSEQEIIDAILARISPRTTFAMIDHVTSNSAIILPVAAICKALTARGIHVLIDGAHAPGMLDLSPATLGCSWYVGNLHKWTCAPKGAAFLWAHPNHQESLQPAVISHGNNCPRPNHPAWQDRFDWPGTFDTTAWLTVPTAIQSLAQLTPGQWPEIRQHNHNLARHAQTLLCQAFDVPAPCPTHLLGSMATIPLPARFQNQIPTTRICPEQSALYHQFHIELPFVQIQNTRYLRVSAHLHNHPDDYSYLAQALKSL